MPRASPESSDTGDGRGRDKWWTSLRRGSPPRLRGAAGRRKDRFPFWRSYLSRSPSSPAPRARRAVFSAPWPTALPAPSTIPCLSRLLGNGTTGRARFSTATERAPPTTPRSRSPSRRITSRARSNGQARRPATRMSISWCATKNISTATRRSFRRSTLNSRSARLEAATFSCSFTASIRCSPRRSIAGRSSLMIPRPPGSRCCSPGRRAEKRPPMSMTSTAQPPPATVLSTRCVSCFAATRKRSMCWPIPWAIGSPSRRSARSGFRATYPPPTRLAPSYSPRPISTSMCSNRSCAASASRKSLSTSCSLRTIERSFSPEPSRGASPESATPPILQSSRR
jgi:hypothetical protein